MTYDNSKVGRVRWSTTWF